MCAGVWFPFWAGRNVLFGSCSELWIERMGGRYDLGIWYILEGVVMEEEPGNFVWVCGREGKSPVAGGDAAKEAPSG